MFCILLTLICPEKSCVLCPKLNYNTRFFRETEIPESKVFFWSDTLYAMNFIFIIFEEALYYYYNFSLLYSFKSDSINKMTFASLSQGFIKEGLKYKLYLGMFLLITHGINIYLVFFLKCLQTQWIRL